VAGTGVDSAAPIAPVETTRASASLDPATASPETTPARADASGPQGGTTIGEGPRVVAANPIERPSLDDAGPTEIERTLTRALEIAEHERGLHVSPGLIELVAEHGAARVIVAHTRRERNLESDLATTQHRDLRAFSHIPFTSLEAGHEALLTLIEIGEVTSIEVDELNHPTLVDTLPQIGADVATANGFDGTGSAIVVIDTGVDTTHPFFAGRLLDEACFSLEADCPNGRTRQTGPGAGAPCALAECDHGTPVAGAALGLDGVAGLMGVASDASLISIQVYSDVGGVAQAYTSDIAAALEHVYDLRQTHTIAAVNLSLGGTLYSSQSVCDSANAVRKAAIDLLRSASIPTIASSGNDADTNSIAAPACISSAISVGAVQKDDQVHAFSNSASFLVLLAPGVLVETSTQGGGYALWTGTSISAPHVSGAMASLLEAVPGSTVAERLFVLERTGVPIQDDRNFFTTPRIDLEAAIDRLDNGDLDIPDPPPPAGSSGPPALLPNASSCGLVGLEMLLVLAPIPWLRRRLRS
jgi:hypothetical protein